VSTTRPRKNHRNLLAARERLRTQQDGNLRLVFVGMLGWEDAAACFGLYSPEEVAAVIGRLMADGRMEWLRARGAELSTRCTRAAVIPQWADYLARWQATGSARSPGLSTPQICASSSSKRFVRCGARAHRPTPRLPRCAESPFATKRLISP
jgi:hypothetical protein